MKRKLITGVVAAVSALTIGCLAGCSGCNNPAPADGAIYQTETESFWVGVGHAYISFEYQAEPANKAGDDNNIYGYVFKVMVSSGGDYESWLNGTWDLKEENNTYGDLTLTATWDTTADNQTKLAGTESGVAKVYTPENGKYKIGVELPSAGTVNFTLDPAKDKVGDKEPEAPAPEVCTNHVDNNCDGVCDNEGCNETVAINHVDVKNNETQAEGADGKCDKCGNDMLAEKTVQVALTTEALGGGTINLYSDNTFDLSLTYGGKILEGEWAAASQTEITLTVDKATLIGGATVSPVGDILTVTVDPSGYPVMAYTCTTNYNTGEAEIPMTFTGSFNILPEPAEKTVQVALTTEALGGGTINLYSDNTFDLSLTYGGKILEGEWAAASQTEITLTVDKATLIGGATVSPVGDILTVTVDPSGYPVMAYTCTTNYNTGEAEIPMTFTGSLTLS